MNYAKMFFIAIPFLVSISSNDCKQRNYIYGNKFRDLAEYKIDTHYCPFDPATVPANSIVYCDACVFDYFFSRVFPRFKNPIILITHNSDNSAPGAYRRYLEDPRLIRWFGQNCDVASHPKFTVIPIGLPNYPKWPKGNPTMFDRILDHLDNNPREKIFNKLYVNIAQTTPGRIEVYSIFKNKPFSELASLKPIEEFLVEIAGYAFILSPFGGGLDCHRTWETLLVGSIPVVKTSTLDPLYDELPVIIVNEWDDVTPEFLMKRYEEMKNRSYNFDKLYMDYWQDLVFNFKQSLEN
jgi:hypothetical protein